MNEQKIVVPKGMLEAAEHFDGCDQTENVVEAALRWLSENPIMPTDEQCSEMLYQNYAKLMSERVQLKYNLFEWQRRMFLAQETDGPYSSLLDHVEKSAAKDVDRIDLYSAAATLLASRKIGNPGPEAEVAEELKDLLHPDGEYAYSVERKWHDDAVLEAYRRGQKAGLK